MCSHINTHVQLQLFRYCDAGLRHAPCTYSNIAILSFAIAHLINITLPCLAFALMPLISNCNLSIFICLGSPSHVRGFPSCRVSTVPDPAPKLVIVFPAAPDAVNFGYLDANTAADTIKAALPANTLGGWGLWDTSHDYIVGTQRWSAQIYNIVVGTLLYILLRDRCAVR